MQLALASMPETMTNFRICACFFRGHLSAQEGKKSGTRESQTGPRFLLPLKKRAHEKQNLHLEKIILK